MPTNKRIVMRRIVKNNFKDITTYAHQEIDRVYNVYKWLASLLGIIVVFGASLIAFFPIIMLKTFVQK